MPISPIRLLQSLLFALATLAATGLLVAAGLNDDPPAVASVATGQDSRSR
ncbi:MAG: hypothetical protein ABIX46_04295 [Burkholderiaceae bacterium]